MKKRTKRLLGLGGITFAAGAIGAVGAIVIGRNNKRGKGRSGKQPGDMWARPGMQVVFRAELMPGRDAAERTFRVAKLLPRGRVLLDGVTGEHTEKEFERIK
jgi:hypothetical protein